MTTPVATTDWRVYLLSTLQFDVGTTRVQLYGAIQASSAAGLTFVLSNDMPFDPQLLPPGQVTTRVDEPFGMTGVRLEQFQVVAQITRGSDGGALVSLVVQAAATFPSLQGFTLEGALVLEQTSPRLALVRLTTQQPLTLTQFVQGVLGGSWDWMDGVTDQFAFRSGDLYYLNPPPDSPGTYTYTYTGSDGTQLVCTAGYHADAVLRIFGQYDFQISLAVVPLNPGNAVTLTTTLTTPLDFDFVTFSNPSLELSTLPSGKYLRVSSGILLFGTSFKVAAGYDLTRSSFVGSVSADLGSLSIPVVGGSQSTDVTLGVEFAWAQGSFAITRIDGLPSLDVNLVQQFASFINQMQGGCEKIVSDWLNSLSSTTWSPGLNGSPTRSGSQMTVPLTLTYTLKGGGSVLYSTTLPFSAVFEIPTSLSDLPGAVFLSLVQSAGQIASDILSNPDAYEALAVEVARRAGAQAFARLLCRALAEFGKDVAQAIIDAAGTIAADTLAAAAELAAALAAVAVAGLSAAMSGILDLLKEFWDWLTGKDEEKKDEAEAKIRAQAAQITSAMDVVQQAIDKARSVLQMASLTVAVDAQGRFSANWAMAQFDPSKLGDGPMVTFVLTLLQGAPGTAGAPWPGLQPVTLPVSTASYALPLDQVPDAADYRMNASVQAVAGNVTILSSQTIAQLQGAVDQLNGVDNDVAHQLAGDLQTRLNALVSVNTGGITGNVMYATLSGPAVMTVGQSAVGVSTRLPA
jgi:hypothetical protein